MPAKGSQMSKRDPTAYRCAGMTYGVGGPPAHPDDTGPLADAVRRRVNAAWAAGIAAARQQLQDMETTPAVAETGEG